jgi:hypothetical protein
MGKSLDPGLLGLLEVSRVAQDFTRRDLPVENHVVQGLKLVIQQNTNNFLHLKIARELFRPCPDLA